MIDDLFNQDLQIAGDILILPATPMVIGMLLSVPLIEILDLRIRITE